ncbi:LysR family transcriptional regulator [Shimia ponticola]|uniref:LysR family transcriptional regulator n=1 Tax=Shimia ponticola TaxID=2582893 RepID=UPI0011BD78F5|nr:LysR family transcriptional regulator [Shimia ponticola]
MIKNRITLKQLEAFVCVSNEGSFRRAADLLGTTQPNISVRIAALEDTLGAVLLLRDRGAVRLTARGKDLLPLARDVLRGTERFVTEAERADLITDRLRLGVTELIAATWLNDFLGAFGRVYPAIRVELTVDVSHAISAAQETGDIDLAILNQTAPDARFASVPVGSDSYVWTVSPAQKGCLIGTVTLNDVFGTTVLTHGRSTVASVDLRAEAKRRGLPVDRIAHSNSLTASLGMVRGGMGVGLLPARLCAEALMDGTLWEITVDWTPPALAFVAQYDAARSADFVAQAAAIASEIGTA